MTTAMWAAVPFLAVVAVDDFRRRRIRNRNVIVLAVVTGFVVATLVIDRGGDVALQAVLGGCLAAAPLVVAALVQPARMGGGDVKLAVVVGGLLGPISPWLSLAAIAGALVLTLALMALRSLPHAPVAPALAASAVTMLFLSAVL
ncbi:MAG: prepilin peptidase [Acidimicrobiia bacterium]